MSVRHIRELADELRHARFDGGYMPLSLDGMRDLVGTLHAAADTIEKAPHWVSEDDADNCCGWYSDDNYCNCWKRDAL